MGACGYRKNMGSAAENATADELPNTSETVEAKASSGGIYRYPNIEFVILLTILASETLGMWLCITLSYLSCVLHN